MSFCDVVDQLNVCMCVIGVLYEGVSLIDIRMSYMGSFTVGVCVCDILVDTEEVLGRQARICVFICTCMCLGVWVCVGVW